MTATIIYLAFNNISFTYLAIGALILLLIWFIRMNQKSKQKERLEKEFLRPLDLTVENGEHVYFEVLEIKPGRILLRQMLERKDELVSSRNIHWFTTEDFPESYLDEDFLSEEDIIEIFYKGNELNFAISNY